MVQIPTTGLTLAEFLDLAETQPASEYINRPKPNESNQ